MQPLSRDFKVFSGSSHPALANRICDYLKRPLGKAAVGRFSDGEIHVEIGENVRGQDIFIIQSTCPPANDHLMELLIMCDALKRASAGSITAVMPYYGYARQDRKVAPRTPITAKLIADMLEVAGVNRVVSMDMHAGQIQGFFNIPSDHLYGSPVFLEDMRKRFPDTQEMVIVSPDAGGVERARAYSKRLNTGLAIIDKRRPRPNSSEVMNLIGDVKGKDAVLVDDMVDTAGTLAQAAAALKDKGARRVVAYAVHPVLSGPAIQRITDSVLEEVVFTDTVPLAPAAEACSKIRVLTTERLFGEAIARIHRADSLSSLFV
jgi:ribose-phosphate pyrophosphokinase